MAPSSNSPRSPCAQLQGSCCSLKAAQEPLPDSPKSVLYCWSGFARYCCKALCKAPAVRTTMEPQRSGGKAVWFSWCCHFCFTPSPPHVTRTDVTPSQPKGPPDGTKVLYGTFATSFGWYKGVVLADGTLWSAS